MKTSVLHPKQTWNWLKLHHAVIIVSWIMLGLFWDAKGIHFLLAPQHLVNAGTFALWTYFFLKASRTEKIMLVSCTLFAILGESLLSLIWVVYHYQSFNLPWFVPPGHALLMLVGIYAMPYITKRIFISICIAATISVLPGLISQKDQVSCWLLLVFALTCLNKPGRPLYAVMLVLAGIMEIYGTSLGNWTWKTTLPYFHFNCPNPPLLAGACYCVLDWMVSQVANWFNYLQKKHQQPKLNTQTQSIFNPTNQSHTYSTLENSHEH